MQFFVFFMKSDNFNTSEWQKSYARGENHCFVASDETVKFVSRYIVKRIGIHEFKKITNIEGKIKVLDACCGIGRNLIFGENIGLEMYGFDLSSIAIKNAKKFYLSSFSKENYQTLDQKYKVSSINSIPWADSFFDFIICESALDSMKYEVAMKGIVEFARIIKNKGLFYCSLISGEMESCSDNETREEVVQTSHEEGTIQSYFNKDKVYDLLNPYFTVLNLELHKIINKDNKIRTARWHVVAKKN